MKPSITASILAGGLSRRMGFNKAFIKLNGQTIIERSVKLLSSIFDEVDIIANDAGLYEGLGVKVRPDEIKEAGSLGGVYTALLHSPAERVFVTACDMPYLDAGAVEATVRLSDDCDVAAPFIGGMFHPMHAVYHKRCLKPIEEMIKAGDLRINALFERVRTKKLPEDDFGGLPITSSVENVNTQEDLRRTDIKI